MGPLVALFAIFAVHKLTRSREREKSAFDLYKIAGDQINVVRAKAVDAWTTSAGMTRHTAVVELVWRLHSLGATVERLRLLSRRFRIRRRFPYFGIKEIVVTKPMAKLRDTLTSDPMFEDSRPGGELTSKDIETAIGDFALDLDEQFLGWLK